MSKSRKPLATMFFLQEWDSAQKVAQSCILNSFIKSKAEAELELEFPGSQLVSSSPNSVAQDDASVSLDSWRCCVVLRWKEWASSLQKICLKNKLVYRDIHIQAFCRFKKQPGYRKMELEEKSCNPSLRNLELVVFLTFG